MSTLSFSIPEALDAVLTAFAKHKGLSKSEVVRNVIQAYLDASDDLPSASCLDLLKGVGGQFKGPADLSYNKKHMRGFGK
jgi:predicted DNA-binding protein